MRRIFWCQNSKISKKVNLSVYEPMIICQYLANDTWQMIPGFHMIEA